jgi:hypothetical protein
MHDARRAYFFAAGNVPPADGRRCPSGKQAQSGKRRRLSHVATPSKGFLMGRRSSGSLPAIHVHASTGHARVHINGTTHWLGLHGSPEAQLRYDALIAAYVTSGRKTVEAVLPPPTAVRRATDGPGEAAEGSREGERSLKAAPCGRRVGQGDPSGGGLSVFTRSNHSARTTRLTRPPLTTFRPRIHASPIRRQTSFRGPQTESLDLVARSHSHGHDVLRGLNERHVQARRQPAARLDLSHGPSPWRRMARKQKALRFSKPPSCWKDSEPR